jgi:hypothetical protein
MTDQATEHNVLSFGAKADGSDDTRAFQSAIDACAGEGGGILSVPAGTYRLDGVLTVAEMVTLRGAGGAVDGLGQPTVLEAYNTDGPFITLNRGAGVQNLQIEYPEQTIIPGKIKPYPWTIKVAADDAHIIGVSLLNPYDGIDLSCAQRHLVRDVHGNPLHIGLYVDQCYDVGRIENVHFWPFIAFAGGVWEQYEVLVHEYLIKEATAFVFGRTDWEYVFNTFCWGYRVGYHFIETEHGCCNGNFQGIGADATNIGVLVDRVTAHTGGLLISNAELVAMFGEETAALQVNETNDGTISLTNCGVWGPSDNIARIAGSGHVTFNASNFIHWDRGNEDRAAINVTGGTVTVSGCRFASPQNRAYTAPQVALHEGTQAATVYGNISEGPWQCVNEIGDAAQIGLNAPTPVPSE